VTAPIIGMCAAYETASWQHAMPQEAAFVPGGYVRKVQAAGGLAVLLVPDLAAEKEPDILLDRIDGLLLVGGVDVQPETMAIAHQRTSKVTSPLRDDFETCADPGGVRADMPVTGDMPRFAGYERRQWRDASTQHLTDCGYAEHRPYPSRSGRTPTTRSRSGPRRSRPGRLRRDPPGELPPSSRHRPRRRRCRGGGRARRPTGLSRLSKWPALRSPWACSGIPRRCPSTTSSPRWSARPRRVPATNDKP